MGVLDGSKFLRPGNPPTVTLDTIRKNFISEFPKKGPHPFVGIDVSIDINIAIKHKVGCQQQHMQPPVPGLCLLLKRKNIHPVFVFDGARNPLKPETNHSRYKGVDTELALLETMYCTGKNTVTEILENRNDDDGDDNAELQEIIDEANDVVGSDEGNTTTTNNNNTTTNNNNNGNGNERTIELKDILTQQKKASAVRADILFEVVKMAKQENIPVVGSAFEADHQLISLKNQNIIDFILTNDGDIPFQGSERTIMNLSKATAHCHLITREAVLQGLKEMFDSARELDNCDLKYLACMLGNDYVN